jgi:glycosyltransferase involved in cell wall biosynthesis
LGAAEYLSELRPLKICFIADARSPIARAWIGYFTAHGHEVTVISSFPCSRNALPGAKVYQVPVALSNFSRLSQASKAKPLSAQQSPSFLDTLRHNAIGKLSLAVYHGILPFDVRRHVEETRKLVARISPDLVHAMRIPFEGILAAKALPSGTPLLISVWGNDFTLWAERNPVIARQTRQALGRTNGLHCDCRRDFALASGKWGFDSRKPSTILPGGGGINLSLFHPGKSDSDIRAQLNISNGVPVVINARGFRAYIRNEIFFQSIPAVLREHPKAVFVCVGMEANPIAEKWLSRLSIRENVRLLPSVQHDQMAALFRMSHVAVSPSLHDGTPNTLLEAMACGCLPVAFDIESVREWISNEVNGLLCESNNVDSLGRAIIHALSDKGIREEARKQNLLLVAERAEYDQVMQQAEDFYREVVRHKQRADRGN